MSLKRLKKWLQQLGHPERRGASRPLPPPGPEEAPRTASGPVQDGRAKSGQPVAASHDRTPQRAGCRRAPAPPCTEQRRLTRQGIPILRPDEDLAGHFMAAERRSDHRAAGARGPAAPASGKRDDRRRPAPTARRDAPRRNRMGIRHLPAEHDLWQHFLSVDQTPDDAGAPSGASPPGSATGMDRVAKAGLPTNRHGIPRLDDHADLHRIFVAAVGDDPRAGELGEVFRQTLDHDARGLMKKKTGGGSAARPLPLKERLRRYPMPQAQLDLHGDTALRARQRTDTFIRTARADGLFTLRVIVGRGLHSEGDAVLPDVIEELLLDLKREDLVLAYRWERKVKRKSGAVIIYLAPQL